MIIKYPNKILRKKALIIEKVTPEIRELADKMISEMKKGDGSGLAGNQIGKLLRIIAYFENGKAKVLINPEIIRKSKTEIETEEGCLSFPNLYGSVVRCSKIKVRGKNKFGKNVTINAEEILAVIFQHEIDHLDGILFVDKVVPGTLHKNEKESDFKNAK
jgi:peptide deformylase